MSDYTNLTDSDLEAALAKAVEREEKAHQAIKTYEDAAAGDSGDRSPADRVKEYAPLQDELEAAETELAALEQEKAGRG